MKLKDQGLLPEYNLKSLHLEEDHLFSLLVKSAGFALGNLSSANMPLACAWRGLPASPTQLLYEGKKIIHSTHYWKNMKEKEIRDWFKEKRKQQSVDFS